MLFSVEELSPVICSIFPRQDMREGYIGPELRLIRVRLWKGGARAIWAAAKPDGPRPKSADQFVH